MTVEFDDKGPEESGPNKEESKMTNEISEEITTTMEFSSEEERNKFIGGNREKRIQVELVETELALEKLDELSQGINDKTKQITDFYYALGEKLRSYELGYPFVLKDEQDEIKDSQYCLHYVEDAEGNIYFHRLGLARLKDTQHGVFDIVVYKYHIAQPADRGTVHVFLEDKTVRLTHASRELRIEAAHVIGDFVQKFLRQVSYSESVVDCALQRVERLNSLLLKDVSSKPGLGSQ